jgi:Protein of unknown function, DUF417
VSTVSYAVSREICYLFLGRLLQDFLICSRRGLASKTHSLISYPAPAIATGSFLLILMSFLTLSSLARTPDGWAPALADPHYGFPYLSRVGHLIFKATINAGRSCDNNGRFRKNISSTREVVRELRSQPEVIT